MAKSKKILKSSPIAGIQALIDIGVTIYVKPEEADDENTSSDKVPEQFRR